MPTPAPSGLYACSAGQDKRVVVWEVGSASPVASSTLDCVVSGVAWRPEGNELALVGGACVLRACGLRCGLLWVQLGRCPVPRFT